jgi:hypothetical protein
MFDLSKEDLLDSLYDELDGYKVISKEFGTQHRWQTSYYYVIKKESDSTFWFVIHLVGNTEHQYDEDPEVLRQVYPKEKTVTYYE